MKDFTTNFKNISILTAALTMTVSTMSTAQASDKSIKPTTAHYDFTIKKGITSKGKAKRVIKKSGNSWTYNTNAHALGKSAKAKGSSTFTISANKIIPKTANTTYKIFGKKKVHTIKYSNKSVVSTYKGKAKNLSMPSQAYDDLSLEVQIRQELLNGKFSGSYKMVKKDKIVKTTFKKSGNTTVTVPAGTFKAVRVDRVHKNKKRRTTFWLAPSLDYLPIKVIQNTSDANMKLELTSVK